MKRLPKPVLTATHEQNGIRFALFVLPSSSGFYGRARCPQCFEEFGAGCPERTAEDAMHYIRLFIMNHYCKCEPVLASASVEF